MMFRSKGAGLALLGGLLFLAACSPSLSLGSAPAQEHVVVASGPAPTR